MLLGRNNFGTTIFHFSPNKFTSKRKTRKELRKICGRNYPVKVKDLIARLSKPHIHSVMIAINTRGCNKVESMRSQNHPGFDPITKDHWCCSSGSTPELVVWRWMKNEYSANFKMKRPKR